MNQLPEAFAVLIFSAAALGAVLLWLFRKATRAVPPVDPRTFRSGGVLVMPALIKAFQMLKVETDETERTIIAPLRYGLLWYPRWIQILVPRSLTLLIKLRIIQFGHDHATAIMVPVLRSAYRTLYEKHPKDASAIYRRSAGLAYLYAYYPNHFARWMPVIDEKITIHPAVSDVAAALPLDGKYRFDLDKVFAALGPAGATRRPRQEP